MSAEQELILRNAGTRAKREAERAEIDRLARGVDWGAVTELLARNRLLPSLGPRLGKLAGGSAGEGFREATRTSVAAARRQDALLLLVGERLIETLRSRGIAVAPLKGPALGEELYGEAGRRLASDIDLLVPAERLAQAVEATRSLGYEHPTDPVGEDGLPLLHFALPHRELPAVELHWRVHWYEERFARERLLPPALQDPPWKPRPLDQLVALLLFYARDGFSGLRQATDLAAWWDRFGEEMQPAQLEARLDAYPELRPAVAAAVRVADRLVGLPSARLLKESRLGARGRLAVALADPRPYATTQQLYAEIGLIDGLLTPRGGFLAFLRRQVAPAAEVIRDHADKGLGARETSRTGYALRILGRYAIALGRLLRIPGTTAPRFASS